MSKIIKGEDNNHATKWERPEFLSQSGHNTGAMFKVEGRDKRIFSEEELKRIYEEGRKEGYENGLVEGLNQGRKNAEKERTILIKIIDHFSEPLKNLDENLEAELVKLSVSIAKQIIRREFKTDPKQIIGVVRESIASLPPMYDKVSIYLNPADAEIVREIYSVSQHETRVEIVDDLSVSRGGCRLETSESFVDASLENRIATIAAELFGGERENDKPSP